MTGARLEALDARAARRWALESLQALRAAREEVDDLNVFPVPDGDTGTNLVLTLESAVRAVDRVDEATPLGALADAFARGALRGARGNSGTILSQMLRGWADVLAGSTTADGPLVAEALGRADAEAWSAVASPVDGTMLSVSRAAAEAAGAAAATSADGARPDLADVLSGASRGAREALARTPDQLAVLARAGVVDAGGRGVVVLLDALAALAAGEPAPRAAAPVRPPGAGPATRPPSQEPLDPDGPPFEVMYLLDADDAAVPPLRADLEALGDSVVVVGGGGLWHVHAHVGDTGAAVDAGARAGRPHQLRIADLRTRRAAGAARPGLGLVAVATGPGLARLLAEAGAVVVPAGEDGAASAEDVLEAVRAAHAGAVLLLPGSPAARAAVEEAAARARREGVSAAVVPAQSQAQCLAAAAVHEPARGLGLEEAAEQMAEAASACRTADVAAAGEVEGAVERLLAAGGELVTLVRGRDADLGAVTAAADALRGRWPSLEVQVVDGGQAGAVLVAVE